MNKILTTIKTRAAKPIGWYKRRSKKNKIIIAITGILLFFLILQGVLASQKQPEYKTAAAKKADVTEIVSETGTVNAAGRSDVYSPSTGVVEELYVSNGDQVYEGQDLLLVKSSATDTEKANAYASYQSALSSLKTAEQTKLATQALLEQNRQAILDAQNNVDYKNEYEKNPATGKNYTDLEKQSMDSVLNSARDTFSANEKKYKEADIAIAAAQAQVNAAWLAYQATQSIVVKSPSEGVVANLAVSKGGAVQAKQTTLTGTSAPVLAISTFTTTEIAVGLNETDSAKVSPGQEVTIEINSLGNKSFEGTVSRVDTIGTDNQGVMQYNTYITVLNADSRIRSGMTADVTITTNKRKNVITVPNAAVKPYKGGRAVRVLDTDTKEITYIPVIIGIRGEDRTEILKGLKEGTEVIVALPNDQINRPSLF